MDMIYMVQTLLSGESEKFFNAVDLMPRDPGGEVVTTTLSELTLKRLTMAEVLDKFDEETARALEDRLVVVTPQPKTKTKSASKKPIKPKNRIPINTIPGFGNLAVEDPCIYDGREVFTEKVAVYGGENSISRIEGSSAVTSAQMQARLKWSKKKRKRQNLRKHRKKRLKRQLKHQQLKLKALVTVKKHNHRSQTLISAHQTSFLKSKFQKSLKMMKMKSPPALSVVATLTLRLNPPTMSRRQISQALLSLASSATSNFCSTCRRI